ncbi:hypothetical protein DPEC_G00167630 [Dallia pectoralis]|uniref:Uncharacterized protein n=1 Tax=Dallia pectoralis TaxID=75939 RepID=A0ACC2GIH0_DALPE|nr:hypothetical protein DPEC_G00167630 [Dallia pectoralis]
MESPPDPASQPGNSASEPATPTRETPVNHPAPIRRQTCSSTNREDQRNRGEQRTLNKVLHKATKSLELAQCSRYSDQQQHRPGRTVQCSPRRAKHLVANMQFKFLQL